MKIISAILLVLLSACSGPADKPYTVTGRHGQLLYLVVSQNAPRTAEAWRGYVRQACGDAHICNVKIWTNPDRAARGFPLTDYEANGIEAAYLINRSAGVDGFVCHPFGRTGQRCA